MREQGGSAGQCWVVLGAVLGRAGKYWVVLRGKAGPFGVFSNIQPGIMMMMNRVARYFSVLNKLKDQERLRSGLQLFPRAATDIITPSHEPQPSASLSPFQHYLLQNRAMERPFTGNLWHELSTGFYHCAVCDSRLFTFNHKFQSQNGYPTFWRAIEGSISTDDEEVKFDEVNSMRARHRTEGRTHKQCLCSSCQSHLGAVFLDGPPPSFLRYTINSALLIFYDMPDFADPHVARKEKKEASKARRITYIR